MKVCYQRRVEARSVTPALARDSISYRYPADSCLPNAHLCRCFIRGWNPHNTHALPCGVNMKMEYQRARLRNFPKFRKRNTLVSMCFFQPGTITNPERLRNRPPKEKRQNLRRWRAIPSRAAIRRVHTRHRFPVTPPQKTPTPALSPSMAHAVSHPPKLHNTARCCITNATTPGGSPAASHPVDTSKRP